MIWESDIPTPRKAPFWTLYCPLLPIAFGLGMLAWAALVVLTP